MSSPQEEASTVRAWLASIEPGFKVACCREEHLGRCMADIFEAPHGLLGGEPSWQVRCLPDHTGGCLHSN